MTAQHLRDFEPTRRHATLVAVILDARATLIDEIIDLHDRFMGALFSKAKRKHAERFQESGRAINDKVRLYSRIGRALLDTKQSGNDPFAAIEAIIPWEVFSESIAEAEKLVRPDGFDYLALVGEGFNQLRRYTPILKENTMNATSPPTLPPEAEVDEHGLASATLSVSWSDGRATHEDRMHVEKFSVWREADLLPPQIARNIVEPLRSPSATAGSRPRRYASGVNCMNSNAWAW